MFIHRLIEFSRKGICYFTKIILQVRIQPFWDQIFLALFFISEVEVAFHLRDGDRFFVFLFFMHYFYTRFEFMYFINFYKINQILQVQSIVGTIYQNSYIKFESMHWHSKSLVSS